jgi:hypothetical protein
MKRIVILSLMITSALCSCKKEPKAVQCLVQNFDPVKLERNTYENFPLDFNKDGVNDATISRYSNYDQTTQQDHCVIIVHGENPNSIISMHKSDISYERYRLGDEINSSMYTGNNEYFVCWYLSDDVNNYINNKNDIAYTAIKMKIGDDYHYGWARFNNFFLEKMVFCNVPNQPVKVGEESVFVKQ